MDQSNGPQRPLPTYNVDLIYDQSAYPQQQQEIYGPQPYNPHLQYYSTIPYQEPYLMPQYQYPQPQYPVVPFVHNPNYQYVPPPNALQTNQNNKKNKNKQKSNVPREPEFYCENCEKDFPKQTKYDNHLKTHITCDFAGCTFEACPKVIQQHKQFRHYNTKLNDLMKKLSTPEEIAKWREERMKNFPTKENIKKRQEEEQARRDRGEIVDQKENNKGKKGKGKRERNRRDKNNNNKKHKKEEVTSNTVVDKTTGSDDTSVTVTHMEQDNIKSTAVSLVDYQPSDDEQAPEECSIKKPDDTTNAPSDTSTNVGTNVSTKKNPCRYFMKGVCKKGDACSFPHDPEAKEQFRIKQEKRKEWQEKKQQQQQQQQQKPKKPSLLEKLLVKEITQERSSILQCLRHIVKNNFFLPASSTIATEAVVG